MSSHSSSSFFLFSFLVLSSLLRLQYVTGAVCLEDECKFDFVISRKQTMTYVHSSGTTFNVELNGSSLIVVENSLRSRDGYTDVIGMTVDPSDVITGDGFSRDVIVVNGQFPGPTIEVLEGSTVVVRVTNSLLSEVTSVHWHGMRLIRNNFMDGVPYVTQCPILPRQSFVYRFRAEPAGTHWYHSHHSNQRIDGLYGLLVVHPRATPPRPFHGIMVTDWFHVTGDALALRCGTSQMTSFTGEMLRHHAARHHSLDGVELTSLSYVSSLIGGRGRHDLRPFPLEVYTLTGNQTSAFRLVNAAADFSFEISADDHLLRMTSLDGHDILPITVDSAIVHPGETVDFEILGDRKVSRYWLRAKTLLKDSDTTDSGMDQEARAILEYREFEGNKTDPQSEPRPCTASHPCVVFNCPFQDFPTDFNKSCRHVHTVQSLYESSVLQSEYGLSSESPEEVFLNFAFVGGSSVNGRKFEPPTGFDSDTSKWKDYITPCDEKLCGETTCQCTNTLSLPLDVTVQMVIMNFQPFSDVKNLPSHHAIHLHGHAFAVIALGFGTRNSSSGTVVSPNPDISCDGALCSSPRWTLAAPPLNLADPPIKDTIVVPAQGYVVVRFRTDNPGRWLAHCHQELHALKGMSIVLEEGAGTGQPRLPDGTPSCGGVAWNNENNHEELQKEQMSTPEHISMSTETSKDKGSIVMSRGTAVGTALGFFLLGAFTALILLILWRFLSALCSRRRTRRQDARQSSKKPTNNRLLESPGL